MKIYLDSEYICHLTNDGTMTAVETDTFVENGGQNGRRRKDPERAAGG